MIQFVTILSPFYFTGGIPEIEVVCYDKMRFTLSRGANVVLDETYWGNSKGRVWIRELGKVIASDLGGIAGQAATYTLKCTDGNTTATADIRAIVGESFDSMGDAANFCNTRFLTLMTGIKKTREFQKEILSLYTTAPVEITIEIVKQDGSRIGPNVIGTVDKLNEVVEIDVSPAKLVVDIASVRRYIIKAGARMMVFFVDHTPKMEEPEIIFRNAFGCRESFVPTGLWEKKHDYENSTGYIRDMLFRFQTKEIRKFSCHTGFVAKNLSPFLEDMFVSNEVFYLVGTSLVPITITDAKVSTSNAKDEMTGFTFDYQLSKPNVYGAGKIDIQRIFDDTFDYTFH